jgi:light-regulated signal transduction histidine kinase (bacteriophytochrome)
MQALVQDLLLFTQAVSTSDAPVRAVVSSEVVKQVVRDLHAAITETEAQVDVGPIPDLRVHEVQLARMLQNLIGNAIKYRRKDVRPEVRVWSETDGSHCVIHVSDNGVGIAPEYHERVFGVFRRLHNREIPGNGIGLAVCKRIVEHYDCRIWLDSEPGVGTTFHFTLPLA